MHEVLVNRLGGLSLPRKSVVRLTDRPDMTLDVYRGRKITMQQQQQLTADFPQPPSLNVGALAGWRYFDRGKSLCWRSYNRDCVVKISTVELRWLEH